MSDLVERIRNLEQRTAGLARDESPEGTSVATKNYPNYIVPSGEVLTVPPGLTLRTGGEVTGSTSGAINQTTTGDGINVIRNGSFDTFPVRLPLVFVIAASTAGSQVVSLSTPADAKLLESGMEIYAPSMPTNIFPAGTRIISIDPTTGEVTLSSPAVATDNSFQIQAATLYPAGTDIPEAFWFGDSDRDVYYTTLKPGPFVGTPSMEVRSSLREGQSWIGCGYFIPNEDCQHMLGSKVSLQGYMQGFSSFSPVSSMALLEWSGATDERPITLISNWSTTPTYIAGITQKARIELNPSIFMASPVKLENIQLSNTFNNLIVWFQKTTTASLNSAFLRVALVQLERGTTSTAYRRYGA